MRYISTRGGMAPASFSEILITGLAPDGGLVVPEAYPGVSAEELQRWRGFDYRELAHALIGKFATDIPVADLRELIDRTYTAGAFGSEEIAPLTKLEEGLFLLRLSNGPSLAFKDMAMQLLGNLFEYVLNKSGQQLNILGATSGDTGSSAEYAMRGKRNIKVFMLSPHQKMSPFQTAQMFSLSDANIFNIAIEGVFDDCQDIVKAVSEDAGFKRDYAIGTVNSINWGRVSAQIVYYFKAYFAATKHNEQSIAVAVPSGNFGNILAGHIARQMGLPIRQLILACNENNVLDEFFRTGVYRVRSPEQVLKTSSPSMDISKASNFERFVFDAVGRDPKTVAALWRELAQQGYFDLSAGEMPARVARFGFVSGTSTHQDRMRTIRHIYDEFGVTIDTHTADGIKVGLERREPGLPLVCLETALPVKFEAAIEEALGRKPERPADFEGIESRPQRFALMAAEAAAVKDYIACHAGV